MKKLHCPAKHQDHREFYAKNNQYRTDYWRKFFIISTPIAERGVPDGIKPVLTIGDDYEKRNIFQRIWDFIVKLFKGE